MADWTAISDSFLEPGKPVRSVDGLALRDNPIALAEGAPGAPLIAGQQGPALRNAGVPDGELGAEKFQSGTTEQTWVMARVLAVSVGGVGTHGFFRHFTDSVSGLSPGDLIAGSDLQWSNSDETTGANPSGTWRALGYGPAGTGISTLFQRVS